MFLAALMCATGAPPTDESVPDHQGPVTVDYDKIISNVEELNALAGEGVGEVAQGKDGSHSITVR